MKTSISKKEAIILIVLGLLLVSAALYVYVIMPRNDTISALEEESSSLSSKASTITRSISSTTTYNNKLTEAKGKAMQYSALYISGGNDNSENYEKIRDIIENIFSKATITSYEYLNGAKNPTNFDHEERLATDLAKGYVKVYKAPVSIEYVYENYQDLMDALADIADNYVYLHITSYTVSDTAPYVGEIKIDVHVLTCNLDVFSVGVCPCLTKNGEVCGQYNEFDADTCISCHHAIDDCPNSTCQHLLELNEDVNVTTCPYCDTDLKKCQYCGQYMLQDSNQCPKCGKLQE